MISLDEFRVLSREYNMIPLIEEIAADTITPITIYNHFCLNKEYSYLLESVAEGDYSFIGLSPDVVIKQEQGFLLINNYDESGRLKRQIQVKENLLDYLENYIHKLRLPEEDALPPFTGGFVGYFSYEMVNFFETVFSNYTHKAIKRSRIPAAILVSSRIIIVFDHKRHCLKIIANIFINENSSEKERIRLYNKYREEINEIACELKDFTPAEGEKEYPLPLKTEKFIAHLDKESFIRMIGKGKEFINRGDVSQLVLSQRFSVSSNVPPFKLYRALRMINPSPYLFFLGFPELIIIGSSPELLVKAYKQKVITRPLAGTRPRGANKKIDMLLQQELLNDEKEKAEHNMLVDLGCYDLGKVCKKDSIRLTEYMNIELFSNVMHIVSEIEGELEGKYSSLDALKSVFPAGTVSGIPKLRSLEIIDRLEEEARGVYGGAVGYLDYRGNLDTCIAIRTIVYDYKKYYIQAGAGVVKDSLPEREYEETLNKARALFRALEIIKEDGSYDFDCR